MRRFIWNARAAVFGAILLFATQSAHGELINRFGNLVFPTLDFSVLNGIPSIEDNRGTGNTGDVFPNDEIDISGVFQLGAQLEALLRGVATLPPTTDPDEIAERERITSGLQDLASLTETKIAGAGNLNSTVAGLAIVNPSATVAGINNVGVAIANLIDRPVLTSDAVNLAVLVVANTDPFVVLSGSVTNTSDTQPLNVFIPFEEAFLEPIALDEPLLRETFLSTELRDTDGDGDASLRAAGLSFQIQATTDIDNPSLANTDPIGVSERLGLPRLRRPGVEFFRTDEAAPVDSSFFVSQRAQISHATGELVLEQLSPGDTVDFTAILSLGIEGDPLTPLVPTESLRSIVLGAELVANTTVPEPSSGLLVVATAWLCFLGRDQRSKP